MKKVKIGNLTIGGNELIRVQSMTTTDTADADATIKQVHELIDAGCEIIRISIPNKESAEALKEIKKNVEIPIVADIHFDYRMALLAAPHVEKLRINPGNIGNEEKVKEVIKKAKDYSLPIRIGVNLGSLQRDIEKRLGYTSEAMFESAKRHIEILEKHSFYETIVSLKASDVHKMIKANQMFTKEFDYPIHLGVTEAGSAFTGTINNAIGMGVLLKQNIGNTIRVSLSADPVEEVKAGWQILKALDLRQRGVKVVACPTCARSDIDVIKITNAVEEQTAHIKKQIKVSVMGCAVNGPGEAKESDMGVVGGKGNALLYKDKKTDGRIKEGEIIDHLLKEIEEKAK